MLNPWFAITTLMYDVVASYVGYIVTLCCFAFGAIFVGGIAANDYVHGRIPENMSSYISYSSSGMFAGRSYNSPDIQITYTNNFDKPLILQSTSFYVYDCPSPHADKTECIKYNLAISQDYTNSNNYRQSGIIIPPHQSVTLGADIGETETYHIKNFEIDEVDLLAINVINK